MSKRTEQVNQLIKNQLGNIIAREIELPEGSLITLTKVKVSVDLKHANVWVSILPLKMRGTILRILHKNRNELQKDLAKRIVMKSTPKIVFKIDAASEYVDEVDKILDEIKDNKNKEDNK